MAVYVDDVEHQYGRMKMCHMWADTLDELLAMADAIGVARKWLQQPPKASWVHFDIAKSKKAVAIENGAILTDKYGPVYHTNVGMREKIRALREKHGSMQEYPGQPNSVVESNGENME